jgi:mycoredoxin
MADNQIRVYGTKWCPDTNRARQVCKKNNIEYVWIDIDQDADGCAYVQKVNKGNKCVPTILFPDGSVLVEPSDRDLEKKLASLK